MKTKNKFMKTIVWLLYSAIAVYSMLDAVQTKMLLEVGATEANPFMDWLITTTGTVYSMFYAKAAVLIFLLVLLAIYLKDYQGELNDGRARIN